MELHPLDGYFLDGVPTKAEAIRAALDQRSSEPRAQPFYRALDMLSVPLQVTLGVLLFVTRGQVSTLISEHHAETLQKITAAAKTLKMIPSS